MLATGGWAFDDCSVEGEKLASNGRDRIGKFRQRGSESEILIKIVTLSQADPYVKIYLLYNGQRIAKKKTHVKKRTLSPVFNESFAFDIPTTEVGGCGERSDSKLILNSLQGGGANLDGVSLELMVLDWDRVTKNEVIGRLELGGQRCAGTALNHWEEVCNSPRRQIAEWHKLNE